MPEFMAPRAQCALLPPIREWHGVTLRQFDTEVVPRNEPAVFRGLVDHWPATVAARESSEAIRNYLARLDRGARVRTFVGDAAMGGRFFYSRKLDGFNFGVAEASFAQLLAVLGSESDDRHVYMGSTHTSEILPGFEQENPLELVRSRPTGPRIWIGNSSRIATHFDESDNIACVVSGTRRFTLFPPDQVENLYPGPVDTTVAGQPTSLVDLADPDLERFPKFAEALEHAQTAELQPGDAIYIPALWWHGVESKGPLNVLVNYWWQDTPLDAGSPMNALGAALLSIGLLPEAKRLAWRAIFDHYVFGGRDEAVEHIPEHARGILGESTPELRRTIREFLIRELRGK
jgi:hypothetical protein